MSTAVPAATEQLVAQLAQQFLPGLVSSCAMPLMLPGLGRDLPACKAWPDELLTEQSTLSGLHQARLRDPVLDIACVEQHRGNDSKSDKSDTAPRAPMFSGDSAVRESVQMRLSTFAALLQAEAHQQAHELLGLGLHYYLAQCALCSQDPALPAVLPELWQDVTRPGWAASQFVLVNAWVGAGSTTRSAPHYDANNNILLCLHGCKRVRLISPQHTVRLGANPVYALSPNHCSLAAFDTVPLELQMEAELRAGDALFLPEGWWHQVDSEPFTMAVNFWFKGAVDGFLQHVSERACSSYALRAMLERTLQQEITRQVVAHRAHCAARTLHLDTTADASSAAGSADAAADAAAAGKTNTPGLAGNSSVGKPSVLSDLWQSECHFEEQCSRLCGMTPREHLATLNALGNTHWKVLRRLLVDCSPLSAEVWVSLWEEHQACNASSEEQVPSPLAAVATFPPEEQAALLQGIQQKRIEFRRATFKQLSCLLFDAPVNPCGSFKK
eukprot:m.162301 g.162301  ORF g.162301 m.162301 type:complete len:499 (-) comp20999_c0_seq4:42-1538(-)